MRLAFDPRVDLDLYVSDPSLETIYYANTPGQSGGELEADARCKEAEGQVVRIERVHFASASPGRYRVGVDFPEACDGTSEASFVLRVDSAGETRTLRGSATRLSFDSRVLEFVLDDDGRFVP